MGCLARDAWHGMPGARHYTALLLSAHDNLGLYSLADIVRHGMGRCVGGGGMVYGDSARPRTGRGRSGRERGLPLTRMASPLAPSATIQSIDARYLFASLICAAERPYPGHAWGYGVPLPRSPSDRGGDSPGSCLASPPATIGYLRASMSCN